jgi:flagellar hook-length control protein FliK
VNIAVDLGPIAPGNAGAAPSSSGDGAAAVTGAELADLFQSLVDDLAAQVTDGSAASTEAGLPAANARSRKSSAQATDNTQDGAPDPADQADPADNEDGLGALLGLSAPPVPLDFTAEAPGATSDADARTQAVSGPQARAEPPSTQPITPGDVDKQLPDVSPQSTDSTSASVAAGDALLEQEAVSQQSPAIDTLGSSRAPADSGAPDASGAAKSDPAATFGTSDKTNRSDSAGWVPRSAAGKALAKALSALTADPGMQKTAPAPGNGVSSPAQAGEAARKSDPSAATAAVLGNTTTTIARAPVAGQPAVYAFAAARAAELQNVQAAAPESADRPATPLDQATRSAQTGAPAAKAAIDADLDANMVKARQSSVAFQAPARSEGTQVQAAQGGQQASIGLAAPVVRADAGEAGTVTDQIVKAIKIQVRDGIGEVRLRLQPEQMGEVHIALKVDRDRVSAVLQVERPELRAQIEGQGQTLRAGLAAQGLKLEDLTVRPMLSEDTRGRDGDQRGSAKDTPQRRRRQSTPKQFELDDQ